MPTVDEIRTRIMSEPDFVNLKRFDYSLKKLMEKYPDGVTRKVEAQALLMTEEEAEELYQTVVQKLRTMMKVDEVDQLPEVQA